jgi:hypothetical protein
MEKRSGETAGGKFRSAGERKLSAKNYGPEIDLSPETNIGQGLYLSGEYCRKGQEESSTRDKAMTRTFPPA